MFKDKNRITRISNTILMIMFFLSLISSISLVGNLIKGIVIEGYSTSDYLYSAVQTIVYLITSGIALLLLNRKIDIYKDEYPISRQIFNLFLLLSVMGMIINISNIISDYFIYDKFSMYSLLSILLGYLPIFLFGFICVNKVKILNTNNSRNTNVINFIVLYLFMSYVLNIVLIILGIIFNGEKFNDTKNSLIISIAGLIIVLVVYRLVNRAEGKPKEVIIKENTEESKPDTVIEKKKKVKVVKKKINKKHE